MSDGENQEKLSIVFRIAFGMGNMLNVLGVVGMWFPYALSFFSKVLLLSHNQAGTIVLVAQVAGGVFTPLVGMLSDICKCPIYGRRKIFHLLGVVAFVCSFFFLWHDCFGCKSKYHTLYYSMLAVVFQFGYAATQIPQLALVPELAPSKHMKVELNSIRFGFQVTGTLVVFVLLWILLDKLPESAHTTTYTSTTSLLNHTISSHQCDDVSPLNSNDKMAFWVMALIVIGLGFVMVIPFHVVVHEKNTVLKKLKWYKWLLKPNFYLVICAFVASKIVTIFTQQYLPFFFLDTLKMNQMSISIGPLVLYIASFVATLAVKKANKLIGEKMLYFIGTVFVWGALMWFWVQPVYSYSTTENSFHWKRDNIYIAIILIGLGGATLMVLSLSMVSMLVGEYSGSSAFVCGWVLFADRVSNGLLNKLVLALKPPNPYCTDYGNMRDAAFYRQVIVYTPFAATGLGLAAICLMAVWDYKTKREIKRILTVNEREANIQIGDAVADRVSIYSEKLTDVMCCVRCRKVQLEPITETQQERQSLIESYREQLLTSSVHEPLQDNDLEISLAT